MPRKKVRRQGELERGVLETPTELGQHAKFSKQTAQGRSILFRLEVRLTRRAALILNEWCLDHPGSTIERAIEEAIRIGIEELSPTYGGGKVKLP